MLIMASILHLGKSGLPKKVCVLVCITLKVQNNNITFLVTVHFWGGVGKVQPRDKKQFEILAVPFLGFLAV